MSTNKKISKSEKLKNEIAIVDEGMVRERIHVIRGVQVMLDFELAEIYGFTTSSFNQQVKRNIERFDDNFRFQLSKEEFEKLSISQNVTSIQTKGIMKEYFTADHPLRMPGISWQRLRSLPRAM